MLRNKEHRKIATTQSYEIQSDLTSTVLPNNQLINDELQEENDMEL